MDASSSSSSRGNLTAVMLETAISKGSLQAITCAEAFRKYKRRRQQGHRPMELNFPGLACARALDYRVGCDCPISVELSRAFLSYGVLESAFLTAVAADLDCITQSAPNRVRVLNI